MHPCRQAICCIPATKVKSTTAWTDYDETRNLSSSLACDDDSIGPWVGVATAKKPDPDAGHLNIVPLNLDPLASA